MDSIWDNDINNIKFNSLNNDIEIEVCIIGAGITGVSIGYNLLKDNIKFAILESDCICSKTTRFSSAKITSQHGIIYSKLIKKYGTSFAKLYLEANNNAVKNIKDIILKENIDCDLREEDSYVYTQNKEDVHILRDEYNSLKRLGFNDLELTDKLDINIEAYIALKFNNQGSCNPLKYTLALANIIYEKNKNIYEGAAVINIDKNGDYYIVHTNKADVKCKYVVIASHFPIKDIPGLYFLKMYQETSYLIALDIGNEKFNGTYITYEDPTISIRCATQNGKNILLVGGNNNKTGDANTKDRYQMLEKFALNLFPNAKIISRWNTEDCITLDSVPYIGHFSNLMPNILVATGYNKWGISSSNVAANIITDIITGKPNKYEKIFKATRYHFIKNIDKVFYIFNQTIQSLIINKYKVKEENIESIPYDTGKIIKIHGRNVGIYKDMSGKIYKVNPYCAHLKCLLTFNSLDKTWDCPCHGSRFDIYGKVINSPSTKDISS